MHTWRFVFSLVVYFPVTIVDSDRFIVSHLYMDIV